MNRPEKIPLLAVVGPTASGKTALAVELAKRLNGEVVSADSMQIYQEMQIGTARPTKDEMEGVPHHLLGFLPLSESFSVAQYVELAGKTVREIASRGKLPILAGGTGLYVSSLVENVSFTETARDDALREELCRRGEREGGEALLQELTQFDPESAARLHPNNLGRIIRAIEIYRTSGITMTEQLKRSREVPSPYQFCGIGLTFADREKLYDRINLRVDRMMEAGLEEEARRVLALPGGQTALQAIGYKELSPYLNGDCTKEEALENLKRQTRRYAKRQLTWFRRDERIHWLEADRFASREELVKEAERIVRESGLGAEGENIG